MPAEFKFYIVVFVLVAILAILPAVSVFVFWKRVNISFSRKLYWSILIAQPLVGLYFLNEGLSLRDDEPKGVRGLRARDRRHSKS